MVEHIDREEAEAIVSAPNALIDKSNEDVSQIRGPIRIKSAQYEGSAKWTVLWGGRPIDVTMPTNWVQGFQKNQIDAPPNTILEVVMEHRVVLDDAGNAIGAPAYTVLEITNTILPRPQAQQPDLDL